MLNALVVISQAWYARAARNPIFASESDGVFSRLSVNAPEFGPLSQVPPRLKAITVGEPDEKSEFRMPRPAVLSLPRCIIGKNHSI